MPTDGRTSITVSDETFEMLKRNKPDGVTWDHHLQQLYHRRREDTARVVVREIRNALDIEGDADVAAIVRERVSNHE